VAVFSFEAVGHQYRSAPKLLGFSPSQTRPTNRSWYGNLKRRISLCFSGEITQDLTTMRGLLPLISALLRCALGFFRKRNEQAIVELALR
jgi:hypothetical protein